MTPHDPPVANPQPTSFDTPDNTDISPIAPHPRSSAPLPYSDVAPLGIHGDGREIDVCVAGPVFLDVIMHGLAHEPRAGEEQWVSGADVMAGGAANQAICCQRLGLHTALLCELGTDRAGSWVRELLAGEGLDLRAAHDSAKQNITVALVHDGDRSFTTAGSPHVPLPSRDMPAPGVLACSLDFLATAAQQISHWRARGSIVIADSAWDDSGCWAHEDLLSLQYADYFVPNDEEAMRYTRTTDPHAAVLALRAYVPHAIVTGGAAGVWWSAATEDVAGSPVVHHHPAIAVSAVDTTGAGDSFTAGLSFGLLAGATLERSIRLGMVVAAWIVQHLGGSASAPHRRELIHWLTHEQILSPAESEQLVAILRTCLPNCA
ncbi:carbohydrate kinase family protein [Trueperella sp. LYQ143]|uniref:carbohydrate kinase family protein n=1 Tax=Trueperella sp. LYQ143 TaxID=3391059 RepID=UPI003983D414